MAPSENPTPSVTGHCLCGAVSITAQPAKRHLEACHCEMCRRWCGSAYLAVQSDGKAQFKGEDHIGRFQSSDWAERGFCTRCGSNLYYRFLPTGAYSFVAGLFDDLGSMELGDQIFIDEKPSYYDFAQDTPRRTGAEVIAEAKAAGFAFD